MGLLYYSSACPRVWSEWIWTVSIIWNKFRYITMIKHPLFWVFRRFWLKSDPTRWHDFWNIWSWGFYIIPSHVLEYYRSESEQLTPSETNSVTIPLYNIHFLSCQTNLLGSKLTIPADTTFEINGHGASILIYCISQSIIWVNLSN